MSWPRALAPYHCFFFERGPESIIRRLQIKDTQGRMLEDIDQYNLVYAVTEICTNNEQNRKNRDQFHMEGNTTFPDLGGWIRHHTEGPQNGMNGAETISFNLTFTPFSAVFGGACESIFLSL